MSAKRVGYVVLSVPSRAGEAADILGAVAEAGVDLLAFTGFPAGGGKAQVDLVSEDMAGLRRVAKARGWKISREKRGFVIQGKDRVGAALQPLRKLARAKINVTAADAVSAGSGRFGMIVWVKPPDYARAARALGAH